MFGSQIKIVNLFALVKIRKFTFRDLWLFLVGVVFVSMTSGAMGAFMLGVSQEDFFIEESDNVLIIAQPGITTPLTGTVPECLKDDIKQIKGVRRISPETLTLAIAQNLNEKSVIVRGISPSFIEFNVSTLIDGYWFDPLYGKTDITQANGAIIGYILAEDLGLSCGNKLQIASTLTNFVIEVEITGILKSNSPCDEEILVSLTLGKSISGKGSSHVSILRVLIDEEVITKDSLSNIINQKYTVPINLNTHDPKFAEELEGIPIIAYTPYGEYVDTQTIGEGNRTEFKLQFGTYEFVASPTGEITSPPLTVFVNQSYKTAFEITIGIYHYNLELNINYNQQPANNAYVFLENRFKPKEQNSSSTNEDGIAIFYSIPEGFYRIGVKHQAIFKQILVRLNESMVLNVDLECSLRLITRNISSGLEVQDGNVTILSSSIKIYQNDNYQSGKPIYLDRGYYQVQYEYKNLIREIYVYVNTSVTKTIYVGKASLFFSILDENGLGLNSNVSIERYDGSIFHNLTGIDGFLEFQLEVGLDYSVTIKPTSSSRIYKQQFYFNNISSITVEFLNSYLLDITCLNGSISDLLNNALSGCEITVFNGSNVVESGIITNSSGQLSINLLNPGTYRVLAEKEGFSYSRTVIITSKNTSCMFKLGKVHLIVLTQSITNRSIPSVLINLKYSNGVLYDSFTTNSSGLADLYFPIGNLFMLEMSKEGYFHQENISYSESQSVSMKRIIELSGNIVITLSNQIFQKISQANIEITNEHYNITYTGITRYNGRFTFYKVPWGSYSLQISYNEEIYPKQVIDLFEVELIYDIQVEMTNPYISLSDYSYKRTGTGFSVVLSAEYVSGFLQTTLNLFITTFTALVIIISVLSLLSIASVISHPIVSNQKAIKTFQQLGATRNQTILGIAIYLGIIGAIASIIGAGLGMWIMVIFPNFHTMNIGGVIIKPKIDILLLFLIIISNIGVIVAKAGQKTYELYTI